MKKTPIVLATLLLAAVSARGGVGDLSHVACDWKHALEGLRLSFPAPGSTERPKGSGVVNPKASVFLLRSPGRPHKPVVSVAIDSAKPGAAAADVVRLDFTGASKFAKAPSLPLKRTSRGANPFRAVFGPAAMKVQRGGKTVPVTVSGQYYYYAPRADRYVALFLGSAVAGKCAFGKTVLPVRVIDGNSNLAYGERASVGPGAQVHGDTLEIDLGDGKAPQKYLYGQPVLVKGGWYEVSISSDASKVAAKRLSLEAGKLKIAHEHWTCVLVKDKQVHHISGGSAPVALPAGEYKLIKYAEYTGDETRARRGKLAWSSLFQSSVAPVKVRAGATTELSIGTPLRASTSVRQSGRTVEMNLKLTDAAGAAVRSLYLPRGRRPAPPKVSVLDSSGKRIYQATMEYG